MSTETPTPLAIPDEALARWSQPHRVLLTDDAVTDRIRSLAAPVVAAELRRMAEETKAGAIELSDLNMLSASEQNVYGRIIGALRQRADEIEHTT